MKTIILSTAIRLLTPLFLLFSVYIMIRGHNHPGGGFIGGLIGSILFVFHTLAHGARSTETTFFSYNFYYYRSSPEQSSFSYTKHLLLANLLRKKRRSIIDTWHRKTFLLKPVYLMAMGLFCAATSGIFGLLHNKPYMSAWWPDVTLPVLGSPGTPLFFDTGIYLMVLGMVLMIVFNLSKE